METSLEYALPENEEQWNWYLDPEGGGMQVECLAVIVFMFFVKT
jgi:hypothetical protein